MSTDTGNAGSLALELDHIASLDQDMERLTDRLRAVRLARANADASTRDAVAAMVKRCEEDPEAGAREMRVAMAGRESEASRALARHACR